MIDDPAAKPENKQVAQKLLDDPLLFGLLDNAKHGHSSNWRKSADDGKIGAGDIDAFLAHSTTKGKEPPPLPPTRTATTPEGIAATSDMAAGEVDDPALKKKKGGGLSNFFHALGNIVLKVGAMALHVVSGVLSVLGKIPIIGELAIPLTMATEAAAGGLDVARTALNGGDVKHALEMMALGVAGSGLAAVTLPGMGAAMLKGAEKVAETTTVKAVETAAEKGISTAVTKGAEKAGEKGVMTATTRAAEQGSERIAEKSIETEAREKLEEELVYTAFNEAANARQSHQQAMQRQQLEAMQNGGGATQFQAMMQLQEMEQQQELASIAAQRQAVAAQAASAKAIGGAAAPASFETMAPAPAPAAPAA